MLHFLRYVSYYWDVLNLLKRYYSLKLIGMIGLSFCHVMVFCDDLGMFGVAVTVVYVTIATIAILLSFMSFIRRQPHPEVLSL